jgi:hypothetical protein
MRVDVMRPAYNFDPKYGVMALTREDWTAAPPFVKVTRLVHRLVLDGGGGTRAGVFVQSIK